MNRWYRLFLVCALCLGLTHPVFSQTEVTTDTGYRQLERILDSLNSWQADFTQTVKDTRDQIVETSKGSLLMKRPGQFRWDYAKPSAQTIVSNGERIWIYDPELEQVTINRLDLTVNGTPAMLLSGKTKIRDSFEVEHVEQHGDLTMIDLAPKTANTDFKTVRFTFNQQQLLALLLTDKLGQSTQLQFSQTKTNPKLSDSQFTFVPPKGVDVIDNSTKAMKAK